MVNSFVESVGIECETIICSTENIEEMLDDEILDDLEFYSIRAVTENLLEMLSAYVLDNSSVSPEDFDDMTIELYQNVKYILEELESMSYDTDELLTEYNEIRNAVDSIRGIMFEKIGKRYV